MHLAVFNSAPLPQVEAAVRPCIDFQRWVDEIAGARPFASEQDLLDFARQAAEPFTAEEVQAALAHHPRIGESPTARTTEAAMSRSEQAGLGPADPALAAALLEGNRAYEDKFGHVFLIRAAGRAAEEILIALRERLAHTPEQEEPIIAQQLREIAVLRLQGVISRRTDGPRTLAPSNCKPGTYRLNFGTGAYYQSLGTSTFFPEVGFVSYGARYGSGAAR